MCGPFAFYKDYKAFIEGTDQDVLPENSDSNLQGTHAAGAGDIPDVSTYKMLLEYAVGKVCHCKSKVVFVNFCLFTECW